MSYSNILNFIPYIIPTTYTKENEIHTFFLNVNNKRNKSIQIGIYVEDQSKGNIVIMESRE